MDKKKILNMLIILTMIIIIASSLRKLSKQNSITLTEYMSQHSASSDEGNGNPSDLAESLTTDSPTANPQDFNPETQTPSSGISPTETPSSSPKSAWNTSGLTGATLNSSSQQEYRTVLSDGFYYEPVSDALRRYITGVSYPTKDNEENAVKPEISFDELQYVHILHYGFDGLVTEGELICNEYIAQDIVEIFYELYRNEYKLEHVLLIDEYDGDYAASMTDNNTFCFGFCPAEENAALSKHAFGLAIDVNPLYNPCITYEADGINKISPDSASAYMDRSTNFPYKIDENDLCYKLFTQYGFTWGGNWNDKKAYQHFQKTIP